MGPESLQKYDKQSKEASRQINYLITSIEKNQRFRVLATKSVALPTQPRLALKIK